MKLTTERYAIQTARWPTTGRHILAQYDAETIIVYQAYKPAIGRFAAEHGYFGGEFSFDRMSWIKPNFLWMMYRSGWGTKEGQEVTLAVHIQRTAFDDLLREAVHSTFVPDIYRTHEHWQESVAGPRCAYSGIRIIIRLVRSSNGGRFSSVFAGTSWLFTAGSGSRHRGHFEVRGAAAASRGHG